MRSFGITGLVGLVLAQLGDVRSEVSSCQVNLSDDEIEAQEREANKSRQVRRQEAQLKGKGRVV